MASTMLDVITYKDFFVYYCPPILNAQSSETDDGHFDISSHTKNICKQAYVGLALGNICENHVFFKLPNMDMGLFDMRRFVPKKRFFYFLGSRFMTMLS